MWWTRIEASAPVAVAVPKVKKVEDGSWKHTCVIYTYLSAEDKRPQRALKLAAAEGLCVFGLTYYREAL